MFSFHHLFVSLSHVTWLSHLSRVSDRCHMTWHVSLCCFDYSCWPQLMTRVSYVVLQIFSYFFPHHFLKYFDKMLLKNTTSNETNKWIIYPIAWQHKIFVHFCTSLHLCGEYSFDYLDNFSQLRAIFCTVNSALGWFPPVFAIVVKSKFRHFFISPSGTFL